MRRTTQQILPALLLTLGLAGVPRAEEPSAGGAPKGEVTKYTFDRSKVFPGTTRDYWIYVPKQYDPARPACLHVNQDGIQFDAPKVFDELIHKGEMPVTVGVFVTPGRVEPPSDKALPRYNRSFEYDGLGDGYARFLLDELLPDVESKTTADGRAIRLSKDGNDRSIGGASSGAIAAFTAAWERPDAFRRVFSAIGTYVGLRGGNDYATLVRKVEPKPLRVFLQDGRNDLNIYAGDWWMANQELERSLIFAGYEVDHAWGEGKHDGKHGTEVFPDAMRRLWKGYPEPVKAGAGSPQLQEIVAPGEGWQLVSEGHIFTEGPAADAKGEVAFADIPANKSFKVGLDGKVTPLLTDTKHTNGQAYGPDGRRFAIATETSQVLAYDAEGKVATVADGFRGNDVVVAHDGGLYATNPGAPKPDENKVWYVAKDGTKRVVDTGLNYPNGVALSPDQTQLYVADMRSHWVYAYQIQPDGSLAHKQKFFHLHVPDSAEDAGADGLRTDADGRLYVATRLGIQVCDQAGRVNAILPTPNGKASNLCFGGDDFRTLFVTAGDKVYKRRLKPRGAQSFEAPIKPTAPRL